MNTERDGQCYCEVCGIHLGPPYAGGCDIRHNCGASRNTSQRKPKKERRPGDMLKKLIRAVAGQEPSSGCECRKRIKAMNEWGWWGCWKKRDVIVGWLVSEAEKAGHTVGKGKCLSLLLAAFREMKRKQKAEKPDGN